MDVVIEDDDAHHHPHAEQHGVRVGEAAPVLAADRQTDGRRGTR